MKLQFKHQEFQAAAARAVCDVFQGQPYLKTPLPPAAPKSRTRLLTQTIWGNHPLDSSLTPQRVLEQLQAVQRANRLETSQQLEQELPGRYNLTVEMETGVGKTYTYIKTIYELYARYGWSKYIVVVPSIAVREGVYKAFQVTREHFAQDYGHRIEYFIYNSQRLPQLARFAGDRRVAVMIINAQAFNARGEDARRIRMPLDEFQSHRPIEVIAQTNPILIIDEPQSVEGPKTREGLKTFNPLFTLRYSATHRKAYNMVYRLDAIDAYNQQLVKKIAVKGISQSGSSGTEGYLYLESINLSSGAPTATLHFDSRSQTGIRKARRILHEGDNLYDLSNGLQAYREGFIITRIDGWEEAIHLQNGITLRAGEVHGQVAEEQLRRLQIRETILSHLERERALFRRGIKVLSLFFIDGVANYRRYEEGTTKPSNGPYADIFEEEYQAAVDDFLFEPGDQEYIDYLAAIEPSKTHEGYFSIDKKGKMVDPDIAKLEKDKDSSSPYELIMRDKERLLDLDPLRSPVRFIFSHSALKEGWDNPNVFQICTLKQSASDIRKRQEVGRGLRLCVNREGERMDANALPGAVHDVNLLTIIASESYESFASALQTEMAEAVASRPRAVTPELFVGRIIQHRDEPNVAITPEMAGGIIYDMTVNGYIDRKRMLTERYHAERAAGSLRPPEEFKHDAGQFAAILDSVYSAKALPCENARANNVQLRIYPHKLAKKAFQELWQRINAQTFYTVDFEPQELIEKAIASLDKNLSVSKLYFRVERGELGKIESREQLMEGGAFVHDELEHYQSETQILVNQNVKYDLIGRLADGTQLIRRDIIRILRGIKPETFNLFHQNPEEFILKANHLINEQKASVIVERISYNLIGPDRRFDTDIFTEATIRGKLGENAMVTNQHHLYDHLVYDSQVEHELAEALEKDSTVAVYVKLPRGFFIPTPVGHYNPDFAIAFEEKDSKHLYFVAETKGDLSSLQLRNIERSKIECAEAHFRALNAALSGGQGVEYRVVNTYSKLLEEVMK